MRALRLDSKRYLKEPSIDALPPILAEEAITTIMQGQEPIGRPMEGADEHLKKLFQWVNSEAFGLLTPEQVSVAKTWIQQIAQRAQQERVMVAAQQFQQALAQGGGDMGGVSTTAQEPPLGQGATGAPPVTSLAQEATGA